MKPSLPDCQVTWCGEISGWQGNWGWVVLAGLSSLVALVALLGLWQYLWSDRQTSCLFRKKESTCVFWSRVIDLEFNWPNGLLKGKSPTNYLAQTLYSVCENFGKGGQKTKAAVRSSDNKVPIWGSNDPRRKPGHGQLWKLPAAENCMSVGSRSPFCSILSQCQSAASTYE